MTVSKIILITVVDKADFDKVLNKRAFNSADDAHYWGASQVTQYGMRDEARGETVISYDYEVETLDYQQAKGS